MSVTLYIYFVFPYLKYCLDVRGGAQDIHVRSRNIHHKQAIR